MLDMLQTTRAHQEEEESEDELDQEEVYPAHVMHAEAASRHHPLVVADVHAWHEEALQQ